MVEIGWGGGGTSVFWLNPALSLWKLPHYARLDTDTDKQPSFQVPVFYDFFFFTKIDVKTVYSYNVQYTRYQRFCEHLTVFFIDCEFFSLGRRKNIQNLCNKKRFLLDPNKCVRIRNTEKFRRLIVLFCLFASL